MAQSMCDSLLDGKHLLLKLVQEWVKSSTFATSIFLQCIFRSCVVATTISLQEQLLNKDILQFELC